MALVATTAAITTMYLATRPGVPVTGVKRTTVYDALVSDLAVNDYLVGSRQTVVSVGATTNGLRALTLRRVNAPDVTVNWTATSAIRLAR